MNIEAIAAALGATPSDIPGLWNLPASPPLPELTSGQLIDIWNKRSFTHDTMAPGAGMTISIGHAADEPVDTQAIIAELRRRDIEAAGISDDERQRPQRAWDPNPPCPDCGSYDHFEC